MKISVHQPVRIRVPSTEDVSINAGAPVRARTPSVRQVERSVLVDPAGGFEVGDGWLLGSDDTTIFSQGAASRRRETGFGILKSFIPPIDLSKALRLTLDVRWDVGPANVVVMNLSDTPDNNQVVTLTPPDGVLAPAIFHTYSLDMSTVTVPDLSDIDAIAIATADSPPTSLHWFDNLRQVLLVEEALPVPINAIRPVRIRVPE